MTDFDPIPFLKAYDGDFEFLVAMKERALVKGEGLTPGMISAIERCARRAEQQAAQEKPDPLGIDLTSLPKRSFHAVRNIDNDWVFIRIDRPTSGKWRGWSFVRQEGGTGGGRQKDGGTYVGNMKAQLLKLTANPINAMRRYGIMTRRCGACGRKLSDADQNIGVGKTCMKRLTANTDS